MSTLNQVLSSLVQNNENITDHIQRLSKIDHNYNSYINKPSINNISLIGNRNPEDLGLVSVNNFSDTANIADMQFNPNTIFTLNANTQLRNISSQPAVSIFNSDGYDVTSSVSIRWYNNILTIDATQAPPTYKSMAN